MTGGRVKQFKVFLSAVLLLALLQAMPVKAEPEWLTTIASAKRQQPEAMLALWTQHKSELAQLPAEELANAHYLHAALLGILGRHLEQQAAAELGLTKLQSGQTLLNVKLLYEFGFAREMQSDYDSALKAYLDGIALANELENEKYLLYGQINHAAILSARNNTQQALELLKDTYQRAQALNDAEVQAEVNAELGLLYATLAYEQEAIPLLKQALTQYQQLGWLKDQITVLYNLARTYSYTGDNELALQTYNQMLQHSLQVQDNINLYHAYLGLAIASSDSQRGDAALSYLTKAEQYLPKLQASSYLSTHYFEKAQIYHKLKQTSQAMQQLLLAEQYLTDEGIADDSPMRLNVWYLKSRLLAEQGEYQKAYQLLDEFIFVFQEARDQENELAFEQLRLALEHERQAQQTLLLQRDNELKALRLTEAERGQQIQLLWLAVLGCSTLLLLILLLWQLLRQNNKLIKPAAAAATQQETP